MKYMKKLLALLFFSVMFIDLCPARIIKAPDEAAHIHSVAYRDFIIEVTLSKTDKDGNNIVVPLTRDGAYPYLDEIYINNAGVLPYDCKTRKANNEVVVYFKIYGGDSFPTQSAQTFSRWTQQLMAYGVFSEYQYKAQNYLVLYIPKEDLQDCPVVCNNK